MKICFLIDDYSATGGIQRVVPLVCNALTDAHEIHVVSMYNEHGQNNRDSYTASIRHSVLISGKKEYIKQAFRVVGLLRKYLRDNQIDVLVETSEMLSPYSFLATLGLKVPYILWTHSTAFRYNEALTQRPFKRLGISTSAYTVALTGKIRDELIGKYKVSNIVSIPNPIDSELMRSVSYNGAEKKIISVGRICYEKYYEKLIEVAEIVLKNNPEWTWDVYGDGEDRPKYEKMASDKGITRLTFKGNANNLYELYREYAFLVMTSRSEAFPMAILEGTASGLPLVAFAIDGVNEMIKGNGYLVTPFDQNEMADCIQKLIDSETLRREFSEKSIQLRNEYDILKIAEKWNALFDRIKR